MMKNIGEFDFQDEKKLCVYGNCDKPLFRAREVGKILGLKNIHSSLGGISRKFKVIHDMDTLGGKQKTTFITEPALYQLSFQSHKPEAIKFTEWVVSEVLPSIRKIGEYKIPIKHNIKPMLCFRVETENDLHRKVVNAIRSHPQYLNKKLLIHSSLGEMQDTERKRIEAYYKGYTKGMADFILFNPTGHYRGLVIEFKTPKGTGDIRVEQMEVLKQFKSMGWKVLISNDYDEILRKLFKYIEAVRVKCGMCNCLFKNKKTLRYHLMQFHRMNEKTAKNIYLD